MQVSGQGRKKAGFARLSLTQIHHIPLLNMGCTDTTERTVGTSSGEQEAVYTSTTTEKKIPAKL